MVNPPPPNPHQSPSSRPALDFDEFVALVVAFLVLGGILFWGLARRPGMIPQSWLGRPAAPAETDSATAVSPEEGAGRIFGDGRSRSPEARIETPLLTPSGSRADRMGGLFGVGIGQESPVPAEGMGGEGEKPAADATTQRMGSQTTPAEPSPAVTETPSLPSLDISDVPNDHWAYPFIANLHAAGYLPDFPEGKFAPDKALTRAELAALVNELLAPANTSNPIGFTDVAPTHWANPAIQRVVGAGYMKGYPEGDFRPDQLVPRYQVMVTLAQGLGLSPASDPQAELSRFADSAQLPVWALGSVAAATKGGLVVSYPDPTVLRPNDPATRAEIVTMLYQVLALQGKVEKIPSTYIVRPSP